MPLPVSSPYDSLATVTQLTRVALGDFIQGIQPNNVGTVNTDATGLIVSWISGNKFTGNFNGVQIIVNGLPSQVAMVTSPTTLTLVQPLAPNQAGVSYSLVIPTGDIFADSQAYVLPTINLAWRKLQKKLDYASHPRMRNTVLLQSLPVVGSLDPSTSQWISWTNFFDGVNLFANPTLPGDFLAPMRLKERQSNPAGVLNTNNFRNMHPATDGLPTWAKGTYNGVWDWNEEALRFPGSTVNLDVQLQYQAFLPDIVVAPGGFSVTQIPVLRSAEALAQYAAALFVTPRGSMLGPNFEAAGDMAVDALTNRQAKLLQRGSFRRRAVYDSSGRFRARRY